MRPGSIYSIAWRSGFAAIAAILGFIGSTALANEALQKASQDPNQWVMYARTYDGMRFSPLKSITSDNVKNLKAVWTLQLGSLRSNESSPLVIGDTLYVTTSFGPKYVYAADATTGALKWRYEPEIPDDVMQYTCCDVGNRGAAYADGKLFVGRLDGSLVALDAKTGKEIWKTQVVDYKQGSSLTSPPLVIKNFVVTGFGGGEYGARGAIVAYDLATGKEAWKTWTVPGPGEPGNDTWKGDSWKTGGGAAWLTGTYDAASNTIFYGTSNPSPWNAAVRGTGTSDYGKFSNLYTASTLALDGDTGKIKWHHQATPQDAWDYDGVNEAVLAELRIGGKQTPVAMKADRNGFFYVLNRIDGRIISAQPFVSVNWAKSIDLKTGRPVEDSAKRPRIDFKAVDICPNLVGGKNWQPMSFSPQTGYVYIPSNNVCMDMVDTPVEYKRGAFFLGKEFPTKPGPGDYLGEIMAWDPVAQKKVWGIKEKVPFNGGTLVTAGNVVFFGTFDGVFKAVDAKTGKELWKFNVGTGVGQAPITYSVNGKQYVAVVVGRSVSIPTFLGKVGADMVKHTPEGGALLVFGL